LINTSGHGILHKAAQRGRQDVCSWFFGTLRNQLSDNTEEVQQQEGHHHPFHLVGPDTDGCCPSDLAGVEGHEELAKWLATNEMQLVQECDKHSKEVPKWLVSPTENRQVISSAEKITEFTWEPWSGVRRMQDAWKALR
jgi:hypothetical protein